MRKIILGLLILFLLAVAILIFNRNIIARFVIVNGIKKASGLDIKIGSLNIGLPSVTVSDLKIYNPAGFKDPILADIPRIYFDFDLPAFFKNKINIGKFEIEVKELAAILNEEGKLNFNSLALLVPKSGKGKPPEIKINELKVKIDKVTYKSNFSAIGMKAMEFNPNINETFHDVTDPSKITAEILHRILSRAGIQRFAGFDLQKAARGKITETTGAIKGALDEAGKDLEKIFSK